MKIDCHCHVFDNHCVPVGGFLASRLGIAISKPAANLIRDLRRGSMSRSPLDYFGDIKFDLDTFLSNLSDEEDKNSLAFILKHPDDFLAFLQVGILSIHEIFDRMKENAPGIDMFVPLMMDMTHAYPLSQPETGFDEQCTIMSGATLQQQGRMMPFYAFDPRADNALQKAKTAIESLGFVGIKLYPPLGYKPISNDVEVVENRLHDLYEYCTAGREDPIPITTHCSWSAGVYSSEKVNGMENIKSYFRSMANPSYWAKVLEKYPKLKVNLGHFGGLGEWTLRVKGEDYEQNWIDPIIGLLRDSDNVYTDISYNYLPSTDDAQQYKRLLLEKIDGVEHRILFGTDWYMSRLLCGLEKFCESYEQLLPDLYAKAAGENAVAFLKSDASTIFFPQFFDRNKGKLETEYRQLFV